MTKMNIQKNVSEKLTKAFDIGNGCTVYYYDNKAGGRTYISDEIGCGVFVYDNCISNPETIIKTIEYDKEYDRSVSKVNETKKNVK